MSEHKFICPECGKKFAPKDYLSAGGVCPDCKIVLKQIQQTRPKPSESDLSALENFERNRTEDKSAEIQVQPDNWKVKTDPDSKSHIVTAEVWLPAQNEMDSMVVNQFISSLPENISMEYYGHGAKRYMMLRGSQANIKYISAKIAVMYPAASVHILEKDPVLEMREARHKVIANYSFEGEGYLPIKTFEKYSEGDPVHTLLAGFLDLAQVDSLWIQVQFLDRAKPEWLDRVLQRLKAEDQKGFVTNPDMENLGDSIGAVTPTETFRTVNLKRAFFNVAWMLGWVFVLFFFMMHMTGPAIASLVIMAIMTVIKFMLPKQMTDAWYRTDLETVKQKAVSQNEFNRVAIRVVAASDNMDSAKEMLQRIRLIFNQYSLAGGNSLKQQTEYEDIMFSPKLMTASDSTLVMWMSNAELGGLWHIPYNSESVSTGLIPVRGVEMRCPDIDDVAGFYKIGEFVQPNGTRQDVNLNSKMLSTNMFLIGKPGTGKTSMMEHIAMAAIEGGAEDSAIIVIDPHGDMFNRLAGCIPEERMKDVRLLDFGDENYVVPYNPLDVHTSGLSTEQSTQLIVDIGKALWSTSWGPRMQIPLQRAVSAISAHNKSSSAGTPADGLSLLGIFLNSAPKGRKRYLSEITDDRIRTTLERYFNDDFNSYGSYMREQIIMPVLSKSYRFEETPMLEFFSAPHSILNPTEIINKKQILLVNTRMSQFGSELSNFIGSFVINIILKEISRQGESAFEKRNPVLLIIDEFQTYSGVPWQELLAQLRKWGGRTVLGTQSFASMVSEDTKELPGIIMSGVYSLITFTVNGEDADYLSKNELSAKFGGPSRDTLISLDQYTCYARFMRKDGKLSRPFFFRTEKPIVPEKEKYTKLMEMREEYAQHKDQAVAAALRYLDRVNEYSFISSGSSAAGDTGNGPQPSGNELHNTDDLEYPKNDETSKTSDPDSINNGSAEVSPHTILSENKQTPESGKNYGSFFQKQ
ncbi:MAG: type IV secretion system DNA-binding domain-containing protein [Anaerolineaceae bacterium]|nr:type IV secretion system DNA-binding domain-containing protein [Anaerolineaceae bacterium]